jgi:major membrane immunogen (membrane-anchored lipoprotein)
MSAHKRRHEDDEDRSAKRHRADHGYSDQSNPFGDGNLTQRFEWKAKDKKLKEQGADPRRMSKEQERQREEEIKVREICTSY